MVIFQKFILRNNVSRNIGNGRKIGNFIYKCENLENVNIRGLVNKLYYVYTVGYYTVL